MQPKCRIGAISSPMFVPCLRGGDSGVAKTEPTPPKRHRRPTLSPRLVCGPPDWGNNIANNTRRLTQNGAAFRSFAHIWLLAVWAVNSARKISRATLPTWRAVYLVRHDLFILLLPGQLPQRIIEGSPWSVLSPPEKSNPAENYPWRLSRSDASCRFCVRSRLFP